jgi:hypothetical protein
MSTEPINYEAVLADLEAKKSQIEAAINVIRGMLGGTSMGTAGNTQATNATLPANAPSLGQVSRPDEIPSGAFHGKSIPEATKLYLGMVQKPQSTNDIIEALRKGGLHPSKYATVWSILYRRETEVADLCRVKGDWALTEWYPHMKKQPKPRNKKAKASPTEKAPQSDAGEKT